MTTNIQNGAIGPSARVAEYTARFQTFLDTKVVPLEKDLKCRNVGTVWQPHLDQSGRMHSVIWEARREVQRQSAAAGLYSPHIRSEFGGGGLSRVEMHHVEEFVYRQSGLGLGLAALGWTEGPAPALEHIGDAVREKYFEPLVAGRLRLLSPIPSVMWAPMYLRCPLMRHKTGQTGLSTVARHGSPIPILRISSRSWLSRSPVRARDRCQCLSSTLIRRVSAVDVTSRQC